MRARSFLLMALVAVSSTLLLSCASSDPELRRTAADPTEVGPAVPSGSGVLREGFDPDALAPPASSAAAGADPHAGHHHHHPEPPAPAPAGPR